MPLAAVALAVVMVIALTTYQSAYARLIFVSGIERHLPRLFTHLNPRTRNPVTAVLVQGVISSTMIVVLYSQSSLATMFLYLQGALTIVWLACGSSSSCRWRSPAGSTRTATPPRTSGGSPAASPPRSLTSVVGSLATTAGIYYTFTLPFSADIPQGDWMT